MKASLIENKLNLIRYKEREAVRLAQITAKLERENLIEEVLDLGWFEFQDKEDDLHLLLSPEVFNRMGFLDDDMPDAEQFLNTWENWDYDPKDEDLFVIL